MPDDLATLSAPMRDLRREFEDAIAPHREALWHFCRRLTGSGWDAEDLVQETLLRALARLPNLWQPIHPRGYLFRIATNLWIDQQRRERPLLIEALDEADGIASDGSADQRALVREAIERVVHLLPPRQRVVLLLCDTLDFHSREVAAMLGTTDGAVKSALQRARARLHAGRDGDGTVRASALHATASDPVVERYVDAFNRRDPDAIAALLDEASEVTIVGSAEEVGRDASRQASLAEWAADPREQRAVAGVLEGRPAIFVLYRTAGGGEALGCVHVPHEVEGRITRLRLYYFCVAFLQHAAALLGVDAVTHGHRYEGGLA